MAGGHGGVTLADVCLASVLEYARDMYGRDLVREHEVLRVWLGKWTGTEAGKMGGGKLPPREIGEAAQRWLWD